MRDKEDRRHDGQDQAAPESEPDGAEDNGEITQAAVGVVIEEEVARGEKMEQADDDDNENQEGKEVFSHGVKQLLGRRMFSASSRFCGIGQVEYWSNGVLECWSDGFNKYCPPLSSITPLLQHSSCRAGVDA